MNEKIQDYSAYTRIYGAGFISSAGETKHIFEDEIDVYPYSADQVLNTDFITSEIQTQYFEINSIEELYQTVDTLERYLAEEVGNVPAV